VIVPTRRTQPYRANMGREQSSALQAMLAGRPTFLPNPGRTRQDLLKQTRTLQDLLRQLGRA
jgi:hypothetical protein